jgi:hypothetical protein
VKKSPYFDRVKCVRALRDEEIEKGPGPEVVAELVLKILKMKNPKPEYAAGHNAALMSHLIRYLPRRMVEKNVRKRFGME